MQPTEKIETIICSVYTSRVTMHLFVYGSLRQGFPNHFFLKNARYIGPFHTIDKYIMIAQKSKAFPYIVHSFAGGNSTTISGELYDVDAETLRSIDDLEGHPEFYRRRTVIISNDTISYSAYIYILENSSIIDGIIENMNDGAGRFELVGDGDWKNYCETVG
jgi:gamma-glutamylcyclotransferase (GGCT)/AIG2-like uncharacterized protein YtfP